MEVQMAKRTIQFTDEQMKILLKNPNVEEVSSNTIKYTSAFKQLTLELNQKGVFPKQIFKDAGFDLSIIGKNAPQQCIGNWKHKEKLLKHTNIKYLEKQSKTNKILKSVLEENKYLKAEIEFLKKLQALQELAE